MRTPLVLMWLALLAPLALGGCLRSSPREVPLQLLYRGQTCATTTSRDSRLTVIEDGAALATLWQSLQRNQLPPAPLPAVDFTRRFVVLAELGQRSSGGYGLELQQSSAPLDGTRLSLPLVPRFPPPHALTPQVMTAPCLLLALDRDGVASVAGLAVETALAPPRPR